MCSEKVSTATARNRAVRGAQGRLATLIDDRIDEAGWLRSLEETLEVTGATAAAGTIVNRERTWVGRYHQQRVGDRDHVGSADGSVAEFYATAASTYSRSRGPGRESTSIMAVEVSRSSLAYQGPRAGLAMISRTVVTVRSWLGIGIAPGNEMRSSERKPLDRLRPIVGYCFMSLAAWVAVVMFLWADHGSLLHWDEIDYVNAARLGAVANAFEGGSMSSVQFVRFAVSKIRGSNPVVPSNYDEQHDPLLLRHYHPPFVVYLLSAVSGSRSERVLRLVQLLGALAFTLTVVFAYRSIEGSKGWPGLLLVSLLAVWMSTLLFGPIWFHGWEAVWSTAAATLLSLLSRPVPAGRNGVAVALGVVLALALLTLETGVFVWLAALLWLVVGCSGRLLGAEPVLGMRQFVVVVTIMVLVTVVGWPGSITKISLLKNFATHGYSVWLGKEYVPVAYGALAVSLLPIVILSPVSVLWLLFGGRLEWRSWGPFLVVGAVYGVGMILFVAGASAFRTAYLGPAFAPLACVVGAACDRASAVWARLLLVVVGCVLISAAWPQLGGPFDQWEREDLRWLSGVLRERTALMDGGHIYQYYLGPNYTIRPIFVSSRGDAVLVREKWKFRELRGEDISGRIVVIAWYRPQLILEGGQSPLLERCRRIERATVRVYDCARSN